MDSEEDSGRSIQQHFSLKKEQHDFSIQFGPVVPFYLFICVVYLVKIVPSSLVFKNLKS